MRALRSDAATTGARSWRGVLLLLVASAVALVLAEAGARITWRLAAGVPLLAPDRILYGYYRELARVDRVAPGAGDGRYDILVLGGSTVARSWGYVQEELREQLAFAGHRDVRIFNLASAGQTSRDSLLAYRAIDRPRFDLVMVYDGANETRTNNAPPDVFRGDYSHYHWYELVSMLSAYHGRAAVALPYTLRFVALSVRQLLTPGRYIPRNAPRPEWLEYGADVRSAGPLEENLRAILDRASGRGERVLLMTVAFWVPAHYSPEAFAGERLGYGVHTLPLEVWGRPADVVRGVAVHNEVVRRLAAEHPAALFVDQARLLDDEPRYFNDACHLTGLGSARFATNVVEVLRPVMPAS